MKATVDGICRGSGKIFFRLRVQDVNPEAKLRPNATSSANSEHIPTLLLKQKDSGSTHSTYVGVLPVLTISSCDFAIEELDTNNEVIDTDVVRINFERAKWESRFNYKVHKELCSELRDFDKNGTYDRVTIELIDCIDDAKADTNVVRGVIKMPWRKDNDFKIACTTASLSPVPFDPIIMGDAKVEVPFAVGKYRREVQFSARMPKTQQNYVFSLEDANHPSFSGLEVVEGYWYGVVRQNSFDTMRNAQFDPYYQAWFAEKKATPAELSKQRQLKLPLEPTFSIVVPLFNTPLGFFRDMTDSVAQQTYSRWELVLVNASPENSELKAAVDSASHEEPRIQVITLEKNLGISENTNAGVAAASGEFICFFDHDDLLEPNLLFEYARMINKHEDTDLLYCDEDKLLPDGTLSQPFFKPDFNLDLLRNNNYICHMLTIRRTLLDKLEPNSKEFDGAQDHNLTLEAVEQARRVSHIAKVLYHWRISPSSTAADANSKPYASEAGIRAVKAHLDRLGIEAKVSLSRRPFTYEVNYAVPREHPLVSIVIPTKDHIDLLDACLSSIFEKSTYDNFEIVVVENNSTEPETFEYYKRIEAEHPGVVRVEYWPAEFNFSKLMNFGRDKAKGDYLLLLNNDTEVITPDWIERMLGICAREDVGIVGVRLLYPDDTIQHAGVCMKGIVCGTLGRGMPRDDWGYFALLDAQQDLSAVTAACMMTKRSVFNKVGGFTEELAIAFNDIDYCLKVRELDKLVVYTPEVELHHFESPSRGAEDSDEKKIRFYRELSYMNYRWASYYVLGDPYYSSNFTPIEPRNCYYHL